MNLIKNTKNLILFKKAFGLNFNNSKIRILQLEDSGKNVEISAWNDLNIPDGVTENYEIKDRNKFKEVLLYGLENARGKFKGNKVAISVSENKVFTRVIPLPVMDNNKVKEAIKWETESNIPIAISDVYFDWQVINRGKTKMEVLVMATPKKIVDNYLSVLSFCGLDVIACEAESVSTGRSVIGKKEKEKDILVIDIGLEMTSFNIYHKGMPIFTSSNPVSGKMMTDAVAKNLNLTHKRAENYKIKTGMGESKKEKIDGLGIFEPILSILIQEIEKTLNFYEENLRKKGNSINRIILCGGSSNLLGIKDYLSVKTKKIIINSSPFDNIDLATNKGINIPNTSHQSFTNVIGSAIRAKNYEDYNKFITT